MSNVLSQLRRIATDLNALAVPHALIGALAVSVHTQPRTTKDIDFAILIESADDQDELVKKLLARGYTDQEILMHLEPTHRLGFRVRIASEKIDSVAIDLLTSSSGIEREVIQSAIAIEIWPGLFVPVAIRAHLLAMKVLSQNDSERLHDRVDIQQLLIGITTDELKTARKALSLITERGFSRGKNLEAELIAMLKLFANQLL